MLLNLVLHAKGVLKIRGQVENYNKNLNLNYTRIPANLRLKIFFEKIIIDISTLTWSKSRKKSIFRPKLAFWLFWPKNRLFDQVKVEILSLSFLEIFLAPN